MYLLTHNDLDGYGCRLVLEHYYNFDDVINTSYEDIAYYLKSLNTRVKDDKIIFITDLNFKTKDDFNALLQLLKNNWKVIYIDHHEYLDKNFKLFDYFKNNFSFKYIIDKSTCATMLTYNYITQFKEKHKDLEQLAKIICIYDTWQKNDKLWPVAFMLNDIFYQLEPDKWYKEIKKDYKIKKEWTEQYKEKLKQKELYYKALKDEGLIIKPKDNIAVFILPDYEFSSHINIDFTEKHKFLVYPETPSISIRHNWDLENEKDKAQKFLENVINLSSTEKVKSAGGHLQAQGITLNSPINLNEIEAIIQHLLKFL